MKTGTALMTVCCLLLVLALGAAVQPEQDISRYIITTAILNSSASLTCNVKLRNFVTWKKNGDKHLSYTLQSTYCQPNTDETIPKEYRVTCIGKQTILTIEIINFNHNGTWTCEDNSEELSAYLLLVENKTKDISRYIITTAILNSSASLTCNVKLRNFVTWKKNGDKHLSYSLQSAYCQPNTDETIPKGYKVTCIGKQTILTIEMINFNHNGTWTCEDNSEELSAYLLLVENKTKDSMTHIPTSRTLTTEMEAQTTATQSTIPSSTDSMTHTPSSRKPTTEMKVQTKATQTRSSLNDVTTNSPGRKYNNAKDMSVDLTPIIAGAVGGAVVFLCVVAALLCWRIRRRSRLLKETNEPTSHYEIPEVLQDSESRKTHLFRCMSKRLGTRPSIDRQIDAVKGNNVDMIEDVPERTASDSSKSIINNDYQNLTGTGNTSNPYETLVDKDDEGRRYERLATYQNALQIEH